MAIKVSGTTVIDNNRQANNLISVSTSSITLGGSDLQTTLNRKAGTGKAIAMSIVFG